MKIVTAAIIRDGKKVLIFRRSIGQALAGFWEFPGGKLEENETLDVCLYRELFEELGIEAIIGMEIGRSIYSYEDGEIELIAFDVLSFHGEIILTVHDKMEWVSMNQIRDYQLAPADIGLLNYLRA